MNKLYKKAEQLKKQLAEVNAATEEVQKEAIKSSDEEREPQSANYSPPASLDSSRDELLMPPPAVDQPATYTLD